MNLFITATDTNVGKSYVAKGIVNELYNKGRKVCYFKPFQSGIVDLEPSDCMIVQNGNKKIYTKNSYVTKTPCTPSISAKIDNVEIDIKKVKQDYSTLCECFDIVITEGSGGLLVPVNDKQLMSDVIKALDIPVIIVARPDLGTINHTLLTVEALKKLEIEIKGIVITNYPNKTNDPAITTAAKLIEDFSDIKILDIIKENDTDFSNLVNKLNF